MPNSAFYEWEPYDPETRICVKTWADGKQSILDLNKVTEDILWHLAHHGAKQKGDDKHSGKTAKGIKFMRACTDAVFDTLSEGEWSLRREGGTRAPSYTNYDVLLAAMCGLRPDLAEKDIKASLKAQGCEPADESQIKDDDARATHNRKAAAARRVLANIDEVKEWMIANGHREQALTLDDVLPSS